MLAYNLIQPERAGHTMLAAVPTNEDRALGMVQLALRLARQGQEVPAPLQTYFHDVVKQALILASEPKNVRGQLLPEAIHLALKLRTIQELKEAVTTASEGNVVNADLADKILSRLEFQFAS